jgi:putative heme degradation protein
LSDGTTAVFQNRGKTMANKTHVPTEEEITLYDAIGRAITNVHAALAEIDAAWDRITAERPNPSAIAFAALDAADEILAVAREDLGRDRTALVDYTQAKTQR